LDRCVKTTNQPKFISNGWQAKQMGLDVNFLKGAAVFTGWKHTGALIAGFPRHRWQKKGGSKHLSVVCTAEPPPPSPIVVHRHKLVRVRVKGRINSQNILKACQAKGLVPACDRSYYDDGKCIAISGNWHLSYPRDLRRYKINEKFFVDSALYCGSRPGNRGRALVNNGRGRPSWTNGHQKDMDTVCTSVPPPPKPIRWHGFLLQRMPIMGAATVDNMIKTCAAKKLKPVCDHPNWNDRCVKITKELKFISNGRQAKQMGLDFNFLRGAAVFTGRKGTGAYIAGNNHRWMKRGSKHLDVVCTAGPIAKYNKRSSGRRRRSTNWGRRRRSKSIRVSRRNMNPRFSGRRRRVSRRKSAPSSNLKKRVKALEVAVHKRVAEMHEEFRLRGGTGRGAKLQDRLTRLEKKVGSARKAGENAAANAKHKMSKSRSKSKPKSK
jgi:hypothetical protein